MADQVETEYEAEHERITAPESSPTTEDRRYPDISTYALLSDCHGSALVSQDGSVDWCCLPRFDARPVFARLLDWERGGWFRIAPSGAYQVQRRYLPDTNILETRFETERGVLVLTDFMALRRIDPDEDPVVDEPVVRAEDRLVRVARVERGSLDLLVEYQPRFDFGRTVPHTAGSDTDLLITYGGADALVLESPVPLRTDGCGTNTVLPVEAGQELCFTLSYQLPHNLRRERWGEEQARQAFRTTREYWREWSNRCRYEGPHEDAVVRSALVLKALMNLPTGAMVAAPTTSLPEEVGGVRNWDYRYTWLRDASHVVEALFQLGYTAEAESFMNWLHRTTAGRPEQMQIMYGVGGERMLPEIEIPDVEGYRGSSPVRTGNAAARQFQLDIYGDLLRVAWRRALHGRSIDAEVWDVLEGAVDYVTGVWSEPDHGIWEVRTEPKHFVHSKVMAWVALDRGVRLAEARGDAACADRWRPVRDEIRARILREGVDEQGRFTRAFDLDEPDAATLMIPLLDFLPADDGRVRETLRWVRESLGDREFLYRYVGPDGLPGSEGAFLVCSFWLVEHLARAGERDEAERLFGRLLARTNDVGLLSEQVHPRTGAFLGNFPQALSHIGLINAALALGEAR